MPTQRLSIADAAAHFAVHPTTIRRRIARGELQAEREHDEPNGLEAGKQSNRDARDQTARTVRLWWQWVWWS